MEEEKNWMCRIMFQAIPLNKMKIKFRGTIKANAWTRTWTIVPETIGWLS